jgi:hypothetical protein
MDQKYAFETPEHSKIVYVRPVAVADLPDDVRRHVAGAEQLYAVHGENGDRIALVRDRRLAFVLARQHDMKPVHVH